MAGFADFNKTLPGVSESLLQEKSSPLSFQREATRYLSWMMTNRTATQRKLIYEFSNTLFFPKDTRVITAILSHSREPQPLATLLALKRQGKLSGHQTVVFLNSGPDDPAISLTEAIRKIRREPVVENLSVLEHRFKAVPRFGEIRGLLLDAITVAALRCGLEDPVVISTDADILDFAPGYVRAARKLFDQNRHLDFLTGDVYWGEEHRLPDGSFPRLTKFPEFLVSAEYYTLRLRDHAKPGDMILFSGNNTVMRLGSYSAIGGMDYSKKRSEDHQIGVRLQLLRRMFHAKDGDLKKFFKFSDQMFVIADPRRWLTILDTDKFHESAMDATRFKGSKMDPKAREQRYLLRHDVIQRRHLLEAINGDEKALAHVRKRISILSRKLIEMDQLDPSPKELLPVFQKMGIPQGRSIEAKDVRSIFHIRENR